MKKIHVAAAIIIDEVDGKNRILATQRGKGALKGGWEFPGGKIEPGETAENAVIREIKEELDAEIEVIDFLITVEYEYSDFAIKMECFLARALSEITLLEHMDAKWLSKEELMSVDWLPADIDVVKKLQTLNIQ